MEINLNQDTKLWDEPSHYEFQWSFHGFNKTVFFYLFYFIASMQQNFGYPAPENMPFDYQCIAYGNNNNTTTNHNHNNSVHLNQTVGTGIGKNYMSLKILPFLSHFVVVFPNKNRETRRFGK